MRSVLMAGVLAAIGLAQQPDPLLWGGLEPGPYAIGYRSYFALDSKRRFKGPEDGPRPVLVNVWYPAAATGAEPLRYRDYLTSPPLLLYPRFVPQLEAVLLDRGSEDVVGKKRADRNPDERAFLEALPSKFTPARRDAVPAKGRFPVLLYHSGAAGSYEDNSVLCEYLASHGYVVMTSAFPYDGEHVGNNYGGPKSPWGDLPFLLAHPPTPGFSDADNPCAVRKQRFATSSTTTFCCTAHSLARSTGSRPLRCVEITIGWRKQSGRSLMRICEGRLAIGNGCLGRAVRSFVLGSGRRKQAARPGALNFRTNQSNRINEH